jgi:hypothetical protein
MSNIRVIVGGLLALSALFSATRALAQTDPVLISLGRSNIAHHAASRDFAQSMANQADLPDASRDYYRQVAERHQRLLVLNQQEVAALEAESAPRDPKLDAVSGPLNDYLERMEAQARDPKANAVSGPLEEYLLRMEAQREMADTASEALDAADEGGRNGQRFGTTRLRNSEARISDGQAFTRIIVNSTGETVVNDRVDVLEAKLEDLTGRQEELARSIARQSGLDAQRKLRRELVLLDREISGVMNELSRLLIRRAVRATAVCKLRTSKVMTTGCEFWAHGMPVVIPQGAGTPISLDHALLEIVEEKGSLTGWRLNLWYRDSTEPMLRKSDQPVQGLEGDLRANPDGSYTMLYPHTDEQGDERLQEIPLQLDQWAASAAGIDFIDQKHPLRLRFERNPDNFLLLDGTPASAEEARRVLGEGK